MYLFDMESEISSLIEMNEHNEIKIEILEEQNYYFKFYIICIAIPLLTFTIGLIGHWLCLLINEVKTLKKHQLLLLNNKISV